MLCWTVDGSVEYVYMYQCVYVCTDHTYVLRNTSPVLLYGQVVVSFPDKRNKIASIWKYSNQDYNQMGNEEKDMRIVVMSCEIWGCHSSDHQDYRLQNILVNPEDEGCTSFQNVGTFLTDTALHARRWQSSCCVLVYLITLSVSLYQ
jgi:hypothetical protein